MNLEGAEESTGRERLAALHRDRDRHVLRRHGRVRDRDLKFFLDSVPASVRRRVLLGGLRHAVPGVSGPAALAARPQIGRSRLLTREAIRSACGRGRKIRIPRARETKCPEREPGIAERYQGSRGREDPDQDIRQPGCRTNCQPGKKQHQKRRALPEYAQNNRCFFRERFPERGSRR